MTRYMSRLIIIGASGHAKVIADLIRTGRIYKVSGFVDTIAPERHGETFYGSEILGGEESLLLAKKQGTSYAFPAFGDNAARLHWLRRLQADGWIVPTLVHPQAIVSDSVSLDSGSVVMAGAVIQADTIVGKSCIINTGATIDHDCQLGDAVHVAPGCSLAGHVAVGKLSMLGIGTVVRNRITIGKQVKTGAGSVVVTDLPDECLAYGVPAKPVQAKD